MLFVDGDFIEIYKRGIIYYIRMNYVPFGTVESTPFR